MNGFSCTPATGLPIVTEVMSEADVEIVEEYADMMQVGARNMQNFSLLRKLAVVSKPILLKRGPSATVKEWLLAAEYLLAAERLGAVAAFDISEIENPVRLVREMSDGGVAIA